MEKVQTELKEKCETLESEICEKENKIAEVKSKRKLKGKKKKKCSEIRDVFLKTFFSFADVLRK